ncbi:FecR family protein [Sunxiuqinia indica]|uniref:FecR family protein n=1 Tax=Sunxiuqinia indica TaxID=2692584 RepID=UPI001356A863|nr:FecR family protein [Sunxiuqinia indica]
MKNVNDILNLITGNIDPDIRKEVLSEIKNEPADKDLYKKTKTAWAFLSSSKQAPDYKVEKSFHDLQTRIRSAQPQHKMYSYYKYAAVLVLIVGIAATMFHLGRSRSIELGHNLQYTSVVADYGQISKVVLPDRSVIWLNSGTTLTYNNDFAVDNRDLTLKGQAFLEVTENKKIPLIVSSGDLKVKVLGTRFDVSAYPEDHQVNVVLESGSVELLNAKNKSFNYKLKPGEMAEYDTELKKVKINEIKPNNYTTWKDGELIFINDPMANVIKRLERKFNIEIVVANPDVYKSIFNANFKNENLKEILDYIEFSCPITYRMIPNKGGEKLKVMLN